MNGEWVMGGYNIHILIIPFEPASAAEWLVATMLASNDPPLCAWTA